MHKVKKLTEESGHWRTSGVTADCGMGFSVYCGGAEGTGFTEGQKRGLERTRVRKRR
jgi:uncharacterized membrane protein YhiD involved in acid resistance